MTPHSAANAQPEPHTPITTPPSTGPTARATLKPTEFNATAGRMVRRRNHFRRDRLPRRVVHHRAQTQQEGKTQQQVQGDIHPCSVKNASAADATTIQHCVISRNRRRSTRSASAPAGSMTRKTGIVIAACTRPTINGDIVSCVINQPAPTFCIHVPV